VANVSYLASSGDFGSSGYANSSVVSVGYTQLKTTGSGDYSSEASVNGGTMQTTGKSFQSGGGSDSSQIQPGYQNAIPCGSGAANPVSSAYRSLPDVAFNGAEPFGLSVYNSLINTTATNFKTATSTQAAGVNAAFGGAPWGNAWGTSIATPSRAALLAIANQARLGGKAGPGWCHSMAPSSLLPGRLRCLPPNRQLDQPDNAIAVRSRTGGRHSD
jgi:hypothetical protein